MWILLWVGNKKPADRVAWRTRGERGDWAVKPVIDAASAYRNCSVVLMGEFGGKSSEMTSTDGI